MESAVTETNKSPGREGHHDLLLCATDSVGASVDWQIIRHGLQWQTLAPGWLRALAALQQKKKWFFIMSKDRVSLFCFFLWIYLRIGIEWLLGLGFEGQISKGFWFSGFCF